MPNYHEGDMVTIRASAKHDSATNERYFGRIGKIVELVTENGKFAGYHVAFAPENKHFFAREIEIEPVNVGSEKDAAELKEAFDRVVAKQKDKDEWCGLKIGDRVRPLNDGWTDEYATVVAIDSAHGMVGTRFDKPNPLRHTLDGQCEREHGWWYYPQHLKLVSRKDAKEPKGDGDKAMKDKIPQFKVGDRVVIVGGTYNGDTGVVTAVNDMVGVVHDQEHEGLHTLNGRCANHYGWWHWPWLLKLADEKKPKRTIVMEITDNGATAKLVNGREVTKVISIKRHPDEEPDDESAALYCIAKLFGRDLRKIDAGADEFAGNMTEAIERLDKAAAFLEKARERLTKI